MSCSSSRCGVMKTFFGNAGVVCRSCWRQYEFDCSFTGTTARDIGKRIQRMCKRFALRISELCAVLVNRPQAEVDEVVAVPAQGATLVRRERPQFVVAARML